MWVPSMFLSRSYISRYNNTRSEHTPYKISCSCLPSSWDRSSQTQSVPLDVQLWYLQYLCSIVTGNGRQVYACNRRTSWQTIWLVQSASTYSSSSLAHKDPGKRRLQQNRLPMGNTHGLSRIPDVALSSPSDRHWWVRLSISILPSTFLEHMV